MGKKKTKNNIFIKIFLDIILLSTFILLMESKAISMAFHEIAGIVIGILFLVHKLLNLKWIKSVTKNLFGKKIGFKTRFQYILDVLLLLGVYTIIITGILMSQVLFPNTGGTSSFKGIHTAVSYICIILIGLHVGLNWKCVMNAFARMFRVKRESKARKWLLRGATFALALWGIASIVLSGFFSNIGLAFALNSNSTPNFQNRNQNQGGGFGKGKNSDNENGNSDSDSDNSLDNDLDDTSDNNSSDSTINNSVDNTADTADLNKYLSGLNCTGCSKHCSLLYPQCATGVIQQQEAIKEFEASNTSSTEGTLYSENGSSYLEIGSSVYTLSSTDEDSSGSSSSAPSITDDGQPGDTFDPDNAEIPDGQSIPEGNNLSNGLRNGQSQGVLNVILTFAPITWLFGTIGYLLSLLLKRKKVSAEPKKESCE
ncbi:MAG: DUF4405 domain-containing protein [Eubacteriales bacterium]